MSGAHAFCRAYLSRVEGEVRAVLPPSEIRKAWAWKSGRHVEFHGPGNFYWHGRGSSAVAWAPARLRSAIAILAPSWANSKAISLPMPLAAPVPQPAR
jgi:hypothetical protein